MSELPNETWTSAYLDGELTAVERAQFEHWLAGNPAAQQLLDELRSVSQSLQGLPRESLGPDFAKRVIERAERAVLLAPTGETRLSPATVRPPEDNRVDLASRPPGAGFDWKRWSRPLLWSAMAAAAALMVMFLSPSELKDTGPLARFESKDASKIPVEAPVRPELTVSADADSDSLFRSEPAAGRMPMLKKEASSPSAVSAPAEIVVTKPGVPGVELNAFAAPASAPPNMPAEQPLAQNLVVVCEVTPQAADQNYFAQVLERNSVSVDVAENLQPRFASTPVAQAAEVDAKQDAGVAGRKQYFYLVEASQRQLTNVLADLQKDRTDVLAVDVDPAPQIPEQQNLTFYCRGYADEQPATAPARNNAQAMPAQLSDSEAPASAVSNELPEIEAAQAAPNLAGQAPVEVPAPAAAPAVEQPESAVAAENLGMINRANAKNMNSQNQLRQQIPVEEQRQLLVEFKNLSAQAPATGNGVAQQTAKAESYPLGVTANQSRARRIDLPQIRQFDVGLNQAQAAPDLAHTRRHPNAPNRAKLAEEPVQRELSGGGSPTKDRTQEWYSQQRGANQTSKPGAAAGAVMQRSQVAADESAAADKLANDEPLMKALFVIQAAPAAAESAAPAEQAPAPNDAVLPPLPPGESPPP